MAPSQSFSPLLLFLLPISVSSLPDTFLPGPYMVDHVHFNKEIFGSLDHAIEVYAPNTPGPKPVFMFFTGLSGAAPAWAYSTLRIATRLSGCNLSWIGQLNILLLVSSRI